MNTRIGTIIVPPPPRAPLLDTGVPPSLVVHTRIEVVASRSTMLGFWNAVSEFVKACGGDIRRADAGHLDHLDFMVKRLVRECAETVAGEVSKTLK